jgi:hypothetical protein
MTTPTPPAGYKLVKGEDIKDRVPEGALIWSSSQSLEDEPEWVSSGRVCMSLYAPGQLTAHYAIPETKPEPVIPEIGPQPPNGYILKHKSEMPEELPNGYLFFYYGNWHPGSSRHLANFAFSQWFAIKNENHNPVAEMRREVLSKDPIETEPSGVEAEVCRDISERQRKGVAKYGTTVAENPLELREWLQHAYEETLDKAIYLKRAIWQLSKENGDGLERAIELLREEKRKRDGVNKTCPMH